MARYCAAIGMGTVVSMLKEMVYEWWDDGVARLAAPAFAISPLLVLVIAITGALFGEEAVSGQLEHELASLVGGDAASLIQGMIARAGTEESAGRASALGHGQTPRGPRSAQMRVVT